MEWNEEVIQKIEWKKEIINLEAKEAVAAKLLEKIKDGDVIAVGSGSTAFVATHAIAKKIQEEGLNVLAVPTSYEVELLCQNLNIPTTTLNLHKPNWGFDGADEVSPQNWLIKGRGGAMFREKLLMSVSEITYILVDDSKYVNHINEKFPIPVECVPEALHFVKDALNKMGATSIKLRMADGKDGPIITEYGNLILDVKFNGVDASFEKKLKSIPGILETGLFIGYNIEVLK